MIIRPAAEKDACEIRRIYAPYVEHTAITFEYDVPDEEEFSHRIRHTLEEYPYLVVQEKDRIIGYAYAGAFRSRIAYKHSAEISIYLEEGCHRNGIGKRLYQMMEQLLVRQNIFVLYACITAAQGADDPHITDASICFHQHMGYHLAGRFDRCGYKFGKWYSMVWMEKVIRERPEHPNAFLPFPEIQKQDPTILTLEF